MNTKLNNNTTKVKVIKQMLADSNYSLNELLFSIKFIINLLIYITNFDNIIFLVEI
jgi:hypothetical protein